MCIIGTSESSSRVGRGATIIMAPVAPSTTSVTTSDSGFVQIMKPKLPRRITRTPRINLNKYWNLFENIMSETATTAPTASREVDFCDDDPDMSNEINENISNEQTEMDAILVKRNNEWNSTTLPGSTPPVFPSRCTCHFCLISDLRNVTVSERNEEVTEL